MIRWWLPTKTNAIEVLNRNGGMAVDKNGGYDTTRRVNNGVMTYENGRWFVMFADGYRLAKLPVHAHLFDGDGNALTFTGDTYRIDIHPGLGVVVKYDTVCDMTVNNDRMITAVIGDAMQPGYKGNANSTTNSINPNKPTLTITHNTHTAPDYSRVIPDTAKYTHTVSLNPRFLGDLARMCNDATSVRLFFSKDNPKEQPVYIEVSDGQKDVSPVFLLMPMIVR